MDSSFISALSEVFKFKSHSVRTSGTNEEPWFCGRDICDILGYVNFRKSLAKYVEEDCKQSLLQIRKKSVVPNLGTTLLNDQNQGKLVKSVVPKLGTLQNPSSLSEDKINNSTEGKMAYINEEGLYSLIFSCKLPIAKQFKKWVLKEVLPSIRKYGEYKLQQTIQNQSLALEENMEQLEIKDKQLMEKEEERLTQEKITLHLQEMIHVVNPKQKDQILYIATTKQYALRNRFKVGGVKSNKHLKPRLSTYNTGRPDGDKMFYCFTIECYDYHHLEQRIEKVISEHREKNTEIYTLNFIALKEIITYLANRYTEEILIHQTIFNDLIKDTFTIPPVIPEAIDEKSQTELDLVNWQTLTKEEKIELITTKFDEYVETKDKQALDRREFESELTRFVINFRKREAWTTILKNIILTKQLTVKY